MKSFDILPEKFFNVNDARMDVNFWIVNNSVPGEYIMFDTLFKKGETKIPDFNNLENEIEYCRIGDLDKNGLLYPTTLDMKYINDEEDENNEIFKKAFGKEKNKCNDIMSVNPNSILIAKTRPLLNKVVYIGKNEYVDYSSYYYTKAFICLECINKAISPIVCYFVLKELLNKELVASSRIGKSGYPSISIDDLNLIKIPLSLEKLTSKELNDIAERVYMLNLKTYKEMNERLEENSKTIKEKFNSLI